MAALDDMTGKSGYSLRRVGHPFSKDYRIYFERAHDKVPVSPFHDIPLYHDKHKGILNMVVEIPRWTNAKFEVSSLSLYVLTCNLPQHHRDNPLTQTQKQTNQITRDESLNPNHQHTQHTQPRYTKNCFPYKGYIWNYGAFPQVSCHSLHPPYFTRGTDLFNPGHLFSLIINVRK
jgi:inorganic pyrophosphatase